MLVITLVRVVLFLDPNIPENMEKHFSDHCILILKWLFDVFNQLTSTSYFVSLYSSVGDLLFIGQMSMCAYLLGLFIEVLSS